MVPSACPETREYDQLTNLPKLPEQYCNKDSDKTILNVDKALEEFTRWKAPGTASDFVPDLSGKEVIMYICCNI